MIAKTESESISFYSYNFTAMIGETESESQPIFQSRQSRLQRWSCTMICCSRFKYIFFLAVLLGKLVGLILYTVWAADCFFREFRTTTNCQHFYLFPKPGPIEFFWHFCNVFVSLFLIYHAIYFSPRFYGTRYIICYLIRKKYFYKITFVLLIVVLYDIYVMSIDPNVWKTMSCTPWIMEKSLTVLLMFSLNFLSRFWNTAESRLQRWLYKVALAIYVLQNSLLALIGSTVAAYKVLTVPAPQDKSNEREQPGAKSVVNLMFLITNNGFRYFVAEFFLTKIFDENLDILGGKMIQESIGAREGERPHEDEDASSHRMVVTL